jgi:TusA-related sulfurtransferase
VRRTANKEVTRLSNERVIDARGLEPPQPLELAMTALCELAPDEVLVLVLDREPVPLYRVLRRHGHTWSTTTEADGRVVVRIRPSA